MDTADAEAKFSLNGSFTERCLVRRPLNNALFLITALLNALLEVIREKRPNALLLLIINGDPNLLLVES